MKKLIIAPLLIFGLFANENNDTLSKLSPEEHMINHPDSFERYYPIKRDGYMPNIITPDNEKVGIYGGLSLSVDLLNAKNPYINNKNYMLGLGLIAGYNYNKYLALESRLSTSLAYDNGIDLNSWSLFLKPKYELYNNATFYSLLGFGEVNANLINSNDIKVKNKSIQLGVGADYKLGNNFKIFADYIYKGKDSNAKYYNVKTEAKSSSFTTGITYDF